MEWSRKDERMFRRNFDVIKIMRESQETFRVGWQDVEYVVSASFNDQSSLVERSRNQLYIAEVDHSL